MNLIRSGKKLIEEKNVFFFNIVLFQLETQLAVHLCRGHLGHKHAWEIMLGIPLTLALAQWGPVGAECLPGTAPHAQCAWASRRPQQARGSPRLRG